MGRSELWITASSVQTLVELLEVAAARRRTLGLKLGEVATRTGISQEMLSRFERGKSAEFGSPKLLVVLALLGMRLQVIETRASGSLDDLRRERGGA